MTIHLLSSRRGWVLTITVLAALLGGCAPIATYNAAYITPPSTPEAAKLPGKALIYTTKADDDTPWAGRPTSFTGSATTLTIPLGLITREIAATVFGDSFATVPSRPMRCPVRPAATASSCNPRSAPSATSTTS